MAFELDKYVNIFRNKLSNGLDVVILHNPKAPIVSLNLSYKVGSKDERVGIRGFAHLFEHLMFEGSKHVAKGEFDKICSGAGGVNNAYTTYDYTAYTMTLPSNQLELGLWLESDRMFYSEITQNALETQQKVVIEEILQTVENRPYGKWRIDLANTAFSPKSSYSWEVHGSKDDVANSTLSDVRNFFATYYEPYNACLVLAGDCEPNETIKLVEKYFGKEVEKRNIPRNNFEDEYKIKGKTVVSYDNVPLNAVFLAFHSEGLYSDDIYTADIFSNLIGTGKSSELYKKLVLDEQIASQVGAFADKREHTTLVTVFAIANSPEISCDELANSMMSIINRLKSGNFAEEKLEKIRTQLISQLANIIQYSSGLADTIGNFTLFWDKPEMIYDILNQYNDIDKEKIVSFLNKYVNNDDAIRVDVMPRA